MSYKIIVNDLDITYKEIRRIFILMNRAKEYDASKIFCFDVRREALEKQAIKHSTFITARKGKELIGFIRIIGDSTYEYYLSEIMVIPSEQGKGIGTKMINKALAYCKKKGFMQIFLTSAEGKENYYSKFGFKPCKLTVMKIKP